MASLASAFSRSREAVVEGGGLIAPGGTTRTGKPPYGMSGGMKALFTSASSSGDMTFRPLPPPDLLRILPRNAGPMQRVRASVRLPTFAEGKPPLLWPFPR